MEDKNKKLVESFLAYCKAHPEERFWQAIRNWSGFPFVLVSHDLDTLEGLQDTFFWKDKTE